MLSGENGSHSIAKGTSWLMPETRLVHVRPASDVSQMWNQSVASQCVASRGSMLIVESDQKGEQP